MEWTSADIPEPPKGAKHKNDGGNKMMDDDIDYSQLLDSVTRITAAGFAGVLVGLSYQKRAGGTKIFQRSVLLNPANNRGNSNPAAVAARARATNSSNSSGSITTKEGFPRQSQPTAASLRAVPTSKGAEVGETNYPLQWAVAFTAFVSILETSRFWSPGTIVIRHLYGDYEDSDNDDNDNDGDSDSKNERQIETIASNTLLGLVGGVNGTRYDRTDVAPALEAAAAPSQDTRHLPVLSDQQKQSAATVFDYVLGGAVAGMAAGTAMIQTPPPSSRATNQLQLPASVLRSGRRSILSSGIGTGIMLGVIAGACQAGLDIAEDYVWAEEARKEEERRLQAQEQLDDEKE